MGGGNIGLGIYFLEKELDRLPLHVTKGNILTNCRWRIYISKAPLPYSPQQMWGDAPIAPRPVNNIIDTALFVQW